MKSTNRGSIDTEFLVKEREGGGRPFSWQIAWLKGVSMGKKEGQNGLKLGNCCTNKWSAGSGKEDEKLEDLNFLTGQFTLACLGCTICVSTESCRNLLVIFMCTVKKIVKCRSAFRTNKFRKKERDQERWGWGIGRDMKIARCTLKIHGHPLRLEVKRLRCWELQRLIDLEVVKLWGLEIKKMRGQEA
jgi:hypothetical protein